MISSFAVIPDAKQRERALDPRQSFIVQAPAGSGKTELLTQRFLKLLSHVTLPEEILAITFTKKAAAEMRARIIKTLKKAAFEPEPTAAHEKMTWNLAQQALQHDKKCQWNLLDNPNRLRIQTIDSFNASLIKFLPILSHFGAPPQITDSPVTLYREAVQEFLTHLEENVAWSDAIAQLLIHLDNDLGKVEKLLINILGKRDQWLRYMIIDSDEATLREQLEDNLAAIVLEALALMETHFPRDYQQEMLAIARFAAGNLKLSGSLEHPILHCLDIVEFPQADLNHKLLWQGICDLLLTEDKTWRKRFDKRQGFPAASDTKNKTEKALYKDMKDRHSTLIENLSAHPHLHTALCAFRHAPEETYQENQWQTLYALYQVLRIVVAQLTVVFRSHGKIDYIENAQAALFALGTDDNPTDLALSLDYQIKHILIDEFQDTSNTQYELIKKLTAGWQPQDGRTLFVVGDPMQSIYRFREAEVGLFIRARRRGIGHIKLEPLTLAVNFRSTEAIVNWINKSFKVILPPQEDVNTGAVSYSPSMANTATEAPQHSDVHIRAMTSDDKSAQAQGIVALIKQLRLDKPHESIAILVRARSDLKNIIPALKKASLTYRAIKIDPLDARVAIQDLMALTRALTHPADRVAWLAVLRAPWCGLCLSDLWLLAGKFPQHTLMETMPSQLKLLSEDGQQRLARVLPVLTNKLAERQRYPLAQWVESTWLLLGGPACLAHDTDLEDVKAYFNLLATLDDGGNLASPETLADEVNKLFATPNNDADYACQIMTIHNAKGLEFDTVILPHLEKQPPYDREQLLLWMEKPRENSQNRLILAPMHATGADKDKTYDHIKQQHAAKADHEIGRLLYVAATRAKQHLYLFLTHYSDKPSDEPKAAKGKSLLKKLLPAIQSELAAQEPFIEPSENEALVARPIQRLTSAWTNSINEIPADPITRHQNRPGFTLTQDYPKIIGTLVHKILETIARQRVAWWLDMPLATRSHYIQNRLTQAGIAASHLSSAAATVQTAINNTLNDSRGLWILDAHTDAKTEAQLTAVLNGEVNQLVIDRTFIDGEGVRWIIDYKTSFYDGTDLEKFLAAEHADYAEKMHWYHHAMREMGERSIKLGLYFPLLSAWREWEIS
jgi:ATP-dependent helicase/nuclease subunit A